MLEELEAPYVLHVLPFPPRAKAKNFLAINPLGTIPYFVTNSGTGMTESVAIVEYLASLYPDRNLWVPPEDSARATYLNFMYMADATLTFPQTLILRYSMLEPEERRVPQVAQDYRVWFGARLKGALDLFTGPYTCGERFTAADIAVAYALLLAKSTGLWDYIPEKGRDFFPKVKQRDAFRRAIEAERS